MEYETKGQKSKKGMPSWVVILIIVAVCAGVGTCTWQFVNLFKSVLAFQERNDAFVAEIVEDGLPPAGSPIYSIAGEGWSQDGIDTVNTFLWRYQDFDLSNGSSCSMRTLASTEELSGTFAECDKLMPIDGKDGMLSLRWRKEEGDWRLLWFDYNFSGIENNNATGSENASQHEAASDSNENRP
ncbi:hypothetical protein ACFQDM_03090 [Ponticaulis profundi]|uniref:DUF4440 domain-containing protein n=2 Tax=Ponticaulis profundi TaxID=2665222 RepID=A0ABW1S6K3_9PROT